VNAPWLWIVGFIFFVWILSAKESENARATSPYIPPAQIYYQPSPAYQQPSLPSSLPSYPSRSFNGYSCTSDCSGHEAGYEWAEENGIDDPGDCDGNSDSFIEGCQAYANEQMAAEDGNTDND
jgi:hypothetical protein